MDANDFDVKDVDGILEELETEKINCSVQFHYGEWMVRLYGGLQFSDTANPGCTYGALGIARGKPLKHVLRAAYEALQQSLDSVRLRHMSGELDYKNGVCEGPGEHGDGCRKEATWLIGAEWHRLCAECAALPEYARKRKRREMSRGRGGG